MIPYKKLLAVIDPTQQDQKALSRALEIAEKNHASVTALLTIYDISYEMTGMLSIEEREILRQSVLNSRSEWLEELIAERFAGSEVAMKVVWHNRPYESIIHEVIEGHYDLVVKGTHQHNILKSVIFTPTDWHLIRKSPSAVLLVKEHEWPQGGQILAAVNQGTEDEAHRDLNERIAATAKAFGSSLKADIHLVNAFPATPVNIAIEIPEFDPHDYNQSVRSYHNTTMQEFAKVSGIAEQNCHVEEGMPEDVIPTMAKKLDAELVIIGTVGRTGISAALIGNTAEHIIDALDCDVLTIKPHDFRSPLQPK